MVETLPPPKVVPNESDKPVTPAATKLNPRSKLVLLILLVLLPLVIGLFLWKQPELKRNDSVVSGIAALDIKAELTDQRRQSSVKGENYLKSLTDQEIHWRGTVVSVERRFYLEILGNNVLFDVGGFKVNYADREKKFEYLSAGDKVEITAKIDSITEKDGQLEFWVKDMELRQLT